MPTKDGIRTAQCSRAGGRRIKSERRASTTKTLSVSTRAKHRCILPIWVLEEIAEHYGKGAEK